MQKNANQNSEDEELLDKSQQDNIAKDIKLVEDEINKKKELEMAKKIKQDTEKLPSNLGGSESNEKATGNLSDNDLEKDDDLPPGFSDRLLNYLKPAVKKFTDLTGSLVKDSRSFVDNWLLGGPSKGKPMSDPIAKLINSLFNFIGFNKTIKLIQDTIAESRLKDNIVPDGHSGSNLQEDKKTAQDSKKADQNLDFAHSKDEIEELEKNGANKFNYQGNNRRQNSQNDLSQALLNDSNQLNEFKNPLIVKNKLSSTTPDPYQMDNDGSTNEILSKNIPMQHRMNQRIMPNNGVARAGRLPMPGNDELEGGRMYRNSNDKNLNVSVKEEEKSPVIYFDDEINLDNMSQIDVDREYKSDFDITSTKDNTKSTHHQDKLENSANKKYRLSR